MKILTTKHSFSEKKPVMKITDLEEAASLLKEFFEVKILDAKKIRSVRSKRFKYPNKNDRYLYLDRKSVTIVEVDLERIYRKDWLKSLNQLDEQKHES